MTTGREARPPILVTGATGFVGRHLLALLARHEERVLAWNHRRAPAGDDATPCTRWTSVDLLDRTSVRDALEAHPPCQIYHLAGFAHVGASWADPDQALAVNVLGTHHLLEAAGRLPRPPRVLVAGSSAVYGPSTEALDEAAPLSPTSPYGLSKLAQEMLACRVAARGRLEVVVTRSFNHVGPGQSADYAASAFARQLAAIESGRAEPIVRVGNLEARRDLTDVRDTVRAYRLLMSRGRAGEPYNVCTGRAPSMRDLLEALRRHCRVPVEVVVDPERLRPNDNPVLLGDASRLRRDTGWRAEIPVDRTLADLLASWRVIMGAGLAT